MPLPHDFRAAAKQPIPVNGAGAPLQVSGSKLQENFEYLDKKEVDGLPLGNPGDMLYHDGAEWVVFSVFGNAPGTAKRWVLHHDGAEPSWLLYDELTVDICVDGTPTEYTILGIPTS